MFVISMLSFRLFQTSSPNHFGDPLLSFYSIFKVFTIEGWYEIPDEISDNNNHDTFSNFFTKIYFIVVVLSGWLFGLSIVNAIFVDEMVKDNNDELLAKIAHLETKVDLLIGRYPSPAPPSSARFPSSEEQEALE